MVNDALKSVTIRTPRLFLRCATLNDGPSLLSVLSFPETMKALNPHLKEYHPLTLDDARERIAIRLEKNHLLLAIILLPTKLNDASTVFDGSDATAGLYIGSMNLQADYQVGYGLHRDYWGRGLATEALKGLLGWVFSEGKVVLSPPTAVDEHGKKRAYVSATADPQNQLSAGVLERCGAVEIEMVEDEDINQTAKERERDEVRMRQWRQWRIYEPST